MTKYFTLFLLFGIVLTSCGDKDDESEFVEVCNKPINLRTPLNSGTAGFAWDHRGAETYTVEYGLEGFEVGAGVMVETNDEFYYKIPMEAGQTYDLYVEAYCNSELGGSELAGPLTYFSENGQFQCNAPSGIEFQILYHANGSPYGVIASWQGNGETSFQYKIGPSGGNPSAFGTVSVDAAFDQISPLAPNDFDFYVRGVCIGGEYTEWTGPVLVNTGG